ncbi:hypothetical protein ED733_004840 [Metarhizium rileyi]|uniref:Uncharacterized protein n=1 Tax=Metarhizium rileyi (strain RCEF 4871) TaxID=1649241 RepID=A0A5C6G9B4_METRR|nr:hypothetical protein ED733_004840 [Metarhizium rileyi]
MRTGYKYREAFAAYIFLLFLFSVFALFLELPTMSRRAFSTTTQKLLRLVGRVTLTDVEKVNGIEGAKWTENVKGVTHNVGSERTDAAAYEIQGAMAHKSHKDANETQNVITLTFYSIQGTRIGSAHVREDGTYSFLASRAGK